MHVRFGGFAPGLLESREHPRASQTGYRRMTTQNRCDIGQYGEDSLALIRLPPLRWQPPHACAVCQPSPNQSGDDTPRKGRAIRLPRNTVHNSLSAFTTPMSSLLRCTGHSSQNAIVGRASAANPKIIEDIGPKI